MGRVTFSVSLVTGAGAASWALAARGDGDFDRELMMGATFPQYPAFVGGTAIGALFGEALGDPAAFGLDAIFPAFFLGLLAAELGKERALPVIAIGGVVALGLGLFIESDDESKKLTLAWF